MEKINIRVYKRGHRGTILIWNTDPLTSEQAKMKRVYVRLDGDEKWYEPETGMPDTLRMDKVMDGHTDTIMVAHDDRLTEETPFEVKITFGEGTELKDSSLLVEPKNQHKAYVKTERHQLANGQFVYADPAYIIGVHPIVLEEIKTSIIEAMKQTFGKS